MIMHAFDGTKTTAHKEIALEFLTGPYAFEIPFVVVNITVVFNLFLGQPWIHTTGAISFSLHKKVSLFGGTSSFPSWPKKI